MSANLDVVGDRIFEGLGGHTATMPIFRVKLTIQGCTPVNLEAAGVDGESTILIGREIMNLFKIVLDGPNCMIHIA